MAETSVAAQAVAQEGTPGEVLRVFLKLGLTSFGGRSRTSPTSGASWSSGAGG